MASLILTISFVAFGIAVGQYVLYNLVVLLAGLLRRPAPARGFIPPITVIIPAYNEEKHIQRKLENILESDYPKELLEVIVVDDGSTDRTAEVAHLFAEKKVLLVQAGERKGKIFAQKTAFAGARNEIIAITDVTVLAPADTLRKLVAHMADPGVGGVSPTIRVRNREVNYLTRVSQFLFDVQNAQKFGESCLDSAAGLFGQFSLVRRSAVGDFSTDVIYEDREFGIALREHGYRARLEPSASATYHAPESLDDFSRQKKRNIGAMTQSLFRHPGLLCNPRYGWYGLLIFPEYALFRILRPHLLILSFGAALVHAIFFQPAVAGRLLATMAFLVLGCYIAGTALLAPLVAEPRRFLKDMLVSIPAMILVASHLATASLKYFRGDFNALWERVKRDRTV
ncbi:glycosyltransferase [Candidatus Poribacteria bacterium]|nr:glycosyltransferase [Candidatus Poribacteria bacterium]